MSAAFAGKFKLSSQENFDEYMKAIGVGMANRMLAKAATPCVEFTINGDNWTMVSTGLRDTTTTFTIGVEKDDETTDGRKVKVVYTIDGGKLVQKERWDGKEATIVREVSGDDLNVTITLGSVVCTRKYKRL